MKKFFSQPAVALFLAVIVVIASVLTNTRVKFGQRCDRISDQFYSATSGTSIADSLRALCSASERLAMLGKANEVADADQTLNSVDTLRNLLHTGSYDADSIFSVYNQLLKETFSLESDLAKMTLSESDTETLKAAQHDAAEAKNAIDLSSYNDSVRSFLKEYSHFPTPQLASISGVEMPKFFS